MVDPALALIVFGVVVVALALVVWPRHGLVARLREIVRLTRGVRMEDTLKHLHDCAYRGRTGTIESVAGALEITRARAVRLVTQLETVGLVHSDGHELSLTQPGRSEALRVLRSHRLWERYLADRTGVSPADWHDEAERREHTLTAAKAERLSASMGHPVYDPHGDPIPTAAGVLPPQAGVSVAALPPGAFASIVLLEDEPRDVFERLVMEGLAPGTLVRLIQAKPERIRLAADGREHDLAPIVAANITVVPLVADEQPNLGPFESLAALLPGDSGIVIDISPTCQGPQRRRLLDLGLVPGTLVRADLKGLTNGPVAYRVRGALIALRRDQADLVRIKPAGVWSTG